MASLTELTMNEHSVLTGQVHYSPFQSVHSRQILANTDFPACDVGMKGFNQDTTEASMNLRLDTL